MFRTDAVKCALIGLMRDLRGIAMATNRLVAISELPFFSPFFDEWYGDSLFIFMVILQSQNVWTFI